MHEAKELAREASNLSDHGFDVAQRLHEAFVGGALGLVPSELSPPPIQPNARRADGHGSVRTGA